MALRELGGKSIVDFDYGDVCLSPVATDDIRQHNAGLLGRKQKLLPHA